MERKAHFYFFFFSTLGHILPAATETDVNLENDIALENLKYCYRMICKQSLEASGICAKVNDNTYQIIIATQTHTHTHTWYVYDSLKSNKY
jgi:hypothetical protein